MGLNKKLIIIFTIIILILLIILFNVDKENKEYSKYIEIIDLSKNIEAFTCDTALEKIYEDEDNIYYLPCIKSSYIKVKINGIQKELIESLDNKTISITDLDKYQISYITKKKG